MMKPILCLLSIAIASASFAQKKFAQLDMELPTPNEYRNAAGAPGHAYFQQQADYKMNLVLDDDKQKLSGTETITYTNNSPDALPYLWLQLDQNIYDEHSDTKLIEVEKMEDFKSIGDIQKRFFHYDGGFKVESISSTSGQPMSYFINKTMLRIDLATPLAPKSSISFTVKWWYNINDRMAVGGRSGYEYFEKDKNYLYTLAQFFPRMCVYSDVTGWQNKQFLGRGEFTLPFGNYDVSITVPSDHIIAATGELQNGADVLTATQRKRMEQAKKANTPVLIVTQAEAEAAEKEKKSNSKTWRFKATNVRDFAFASSRKFIWDAQNVTVGGKNILCMSFYPKEGNPLWEEFSTKAVALTLKSYSSHTFDYPYPKAISVHAKNQGMEYPMICWNYGRPNEDGTYSDGVKYGMISVIIHEVGHNFFPMIVNSDERQWGWMDEGLDTFMQYMAEQEFGEAFPEAIAPLEAYPSRRGAPAKIVPYMAGDQSFIAPIMSNPENVYQLGPNAYGKPATALNILRETVMGRELFDHAFKTYANRWKFKHPTPEDFFRTMEDASAVDLDYFWRGWFYTTDFVDIGVKGVKKYYVSNEPTKQMKEYMAARNITEADLPPLVYLAAEDSEDYNPELKGKKPSESSQTLNAFMMDNMTESERAAVKEPKYFYEVTFNKPGGIPMPLIVEYTYADGTTKSVTYPAEIWRKSDAEVKTVLSTEKEIVGIVVDPKAETADIDTSNNSWPKAEARSEFDTFKAGIKD
jgi:hypothetical protein